MKKTGWAGQKQLKRWKTILPIGLLILGLSFVPLMAVTVPACKGSSTEKKPAKEPEVSIKEYWQSLFKDDPESKKEFERIQAEFRTGKHSLAVQDLQELLKRSPQAPWAEAVELYLGQVWTLLRQYGSALRQFDLFVTRYPTSPMVPRVLISKGEIYLAMGKQRRDSNAEDPGGEQLLQVAKEIFQQTLKEYPSNPTVEAEALYSLGEIYSTLEEPARAKEAFRKVAEAYPDSPNTSKALYSLGGVLLGEADLEGAEGVFREITERYPNTRLAGKAANKLEGIRLVGSQAPPLQIKEWIGGPPPEGEGTRGKLTLLSFWSIWCPHCKRNIPKMERLLATYGTRGVSVVGITRVKDDPGVEQIKEYVDTHPMSYPTGVDEAGSMSQAMAVKSVPCVVAVDSQGRIRWHGHPDHLSEKVIEDLLQPSS